MSLSIDYFIKCRRIREMHNSLSKISGSDSVKVLSGRFKQFSDFPLETFLPFRPIQSDFQGINK